MSNAEELAKYKKLLDDRVITQEDFDKKKEQLLNSNESTCLLYTSPSPRDRG